MSFQNSDEAKSFAVEVTSHRQNHDQAMHSLQYFKANRDKADGDSKQFWGQRVAELEAWLASEEYKNGDYPQGIDDLMLELMEWRASIYALQHAVTESYPFSEHVFFQQWLIGGAYTIHCLIGKLVGIDPRENSLRNLWRKINRFIARDGACKKPELKFIDEQLHKVTGQFTANRSKCILVRNNVIAHNEKNLKIEWSKIDTDIRILTRIWSIIVSWSCFGIISPFRTSEQAFSGLERFFSQQEMQELAKKRQEHLDMCIAWARTHLHNGKHDPSAYFIAKITVTSKVLTP